MAPKLSDRSDTPPNSLLEYGDTSDLRKLFNLRETAIYQLFRAGKITGALLRRDKRSPRGKRLFNIASVRRYLASLEATRYTAPNCRKNARRFCKKKAASALRNRH
jgi:hypothetical protein